MFNNILHVRSRRSFIASIDKCISLELKLTKNFEITFLELINKYNTLLIKTNYSQNDKFDFIKLRNILN